MKSGVKFLLSTWCLARFRTKIFICKLNGENFDVRELED